MGTAEEDTKVENGGNLNSSTSGGGRGGGQPRRKSKKVMDDGSVSWEYADDHLEGRVTIDLEAKIKSDKYTKDFIKELSGNALSVAHFQREGFNNPIFVSDKEGLGIKVPGKGFSVGDVRTAVGSRRNVDVMDVQTQKNISMSMKEWHKYFDQSSAARNDLLNVISLEISNTKLDGQIQAPKVVRQIDWVDKVWPRHLKEMQIEATNNMDDMMYPKVQKYCLMSVKGCWTDFHIDLGGTSVWYHILQGGKIFWLIPPTDENLKRYEEWVLSGKQSDVFFGDMVDKCGRFEIPAGGTFFIPSGWIHAVYTVQDSIVFGGNFLHSFSIEKQLQVAHIEEITHVPNKFRFPFFTEMLWYALDRYVHCLLGRTHLDLPEEEKRRMRLEKGENVDPNKEVLKIAAGNGGSSGGAGDANHVNLTQAELYGLKFIVMYLHHLPHSKKNVPVMLPDPISVVKDIRTLVVNHKDDCPEKAITGKYVLRWTETDDVDGSGGAGGAGGGGGGKRPRKSLPKIPQVCPGGNMTAGGGTPGGGTPVTERKKPGPKPGSTRKNPIPPEEKKNSGNRRRRVRCKICEACVGGDCKQCAYCKDMIKYGGPGKMKQTCEKRRCVRPQLPVCAYCSECKLDGWGNEPKVQGKEAERPEDPSNLYECTVCLDILHPECAKKTIGMGQMNSELSNSWECAKCVNSGYSSAPSRSGKRAAAAAAPSTPNNANADENASKKLKTDQQHQVVVGSTPT